MWTKGQEGDGCVKTSGNRVVVSAGLPDPDGLGSSPSSATYNSVSSMTSRSGSFLIYKRGRSPPHRLKELNIGKALRMLICSYCSDDLMLVGKEGQRLWKARADGKEANSDWKSWDEGAQKQ